MKTLVVNADDFGLTPGVSEGILRAHCRGVVTSTSALVVGPAFEGHVGALLDVGLPAGVHLCAVGEDPPMLPADQVPSLVDRRGRFPLTWRTVVERAVRGAIDPADLRREFEAQIDAARATGIEPTHLDTHQNLHLWPLVSNVVVELAARHRIPLVRVTRTHRRTPFALGVRALSAAAAAKARQAGLIVPEAAAGLDTAGALDERGLRAEVSALGRSRGHSDLTVHPGLDHDPDRARYRWGYAWADELEALCAPGIRDHVAASGFRLGSFADLAGSAG